jgi:hypothetical protein
LKYDPDASWYGIVLVIGKGSITAEKSGSGAFYGAVLVANTAGLAPTARLGAATFDFSQGSAGNGIFYSSCLIKQAQTPLKYKVLSFRER